MIENNHMHPVTAYDTHATPAQCNTLIATNIHIMQKMLYLHAVDTSHLKNRMIGSRKPNFWVGQWAGYSQRQ